MCYTDIERLDPAGNTPLLLAYFLNRTEAAKLLLAAGAMAKARTKQLNEAIEVRAQTTQRRRAVPCSKL